MPFLAGDVRNKEEHNFRRGNPTGRLGRDSQPCGKLSGKMATVMKELEFEISDLVENFVYVFRVMAFNAIGVR